MEKKPLGYWNYTVYLTYIGMLSGFFGIGMVMEGKVRIAMWCLIIAGICDMFDGAVASTRKRTKNEKCFGIQIDSLSDLICFGVLPATIVIRICSGWEWSYGVGGLYVLFALIRLGYFNVDEMNRQEQTTERRKYYLGLPVTLIAIILPLFFPPMCMIGIPKNIAAVVILFIVAICFLTPFKIKKPKLPLKLVMGLCGAAEIAFLILGLGDI